MKKYEKPRFPYLMYIIPVLILATIGLLVSSYLTVSHYRNYVDIGYSSFCAISASINCDTVSQSPWSIFFGIPLALWGILAYLAYFSISFLAVKDNSENLKLWDFLFVLSSFFVLADGYFFYLSFVKIKAYCLMCVISYAINFGLLFNAWIIRRRFGQHFSLSQILPNLASASRRRAVQFVLFSILTIFILLELFLPKYWTFQLPPMTYITKQGETEDGRPWIGAENPVFVIHEFADYQCFQCRKMHLTLRYLINKNPKTLRIVHHNFPMDENFNTLLVKKPFHTGSGNLALLALAASRQNKFWEVNDAIYSIVGLELKNFNINKFAAKLSLDAQQLKEDMYSKPIVKQLEGDIRLGLKNGIIGTPSYIVDGKVYAGHVPENVLKRLIQQYGAE